jgi:hypothetical protein
MTPADATILSALIGALVAALGLLCVWIAGRHQRLAGFRAAALEKRLEAHQEAYRLWYEMVGAIHDPKKGPEAAARCQDWWVSHCLYLDAKVREEFIRCAREAFLYRNLMIPDKPELTEARFQRINRVFDLLVEGVQLPSIGEHEGRKNEPKA